MNRAVFQRVFAASVLLMFIATGCAPSGPQLGRVEGEVLLDGKPLADVVVEFQPQQAGSPSIGVTDEDGKFQLQFTRDRWGALLGEHTVKIEHDVDGREGPRSSAAIPVRYNALSELKRTVTTGSNFFEFKLRTDHQTASTIH